MGGFKSAIGRTLKGAAMSYQRYPAAMLAATALAAITSIRIADNSLLASGQFDRWQFVFALTALFSLALSGWLYSRKDPKRSELISLAGLITIVPLFFLIRPVDGRIPFLTSSRAVAAGAIAIIILLLAISRSSEKTDFNKRFFMLHKAFFIALLYMLVVMGGLNFTAAAVETLLYNEMSSDVYQYLTTWSAFLGFAFFLGNLPDLKRSAPFDAVHISQKQPRFIEVLFTFVMIPIVLALSFVLLLWALRMLISRSWPDFAQLASIFSGYIILGTWLTIMVADSTHGLAKFFRRAYPVLAIIFLAVESVAIFRQIDRFGIRGGEYAAAVVLIFGISSAVYFLIKPIRLNHLSAWTAAVLILISVLPLTGFSDVTLNSQLSRLNNVLERYGMLQGDTIKPADKNNIPAKEDQVLITEAVSYLTSLDRYEDMPTWFPQEERIYQDFTKIFGFEQRWDYQDGDSYKPGNTASWVRADNTVIDISGYDLVLTDSINKSGIDVSFTTDLGEYDLNVVDVEPVNGQAPSLIISRNGSEIVNRSLEAELAPIGEEAKASKMYEYIVEPEDLQITVEENGVRVLIVIKSLDISWEGDTMRYFINLGGVYFTDNTES